MQDIDKQLFAAAKGGVICEVVGLLRQGADAKAADFMGVTPLMVAALKNHSACVRALLPFSDARAVDEEGATALIYACQHMRLECAKELVAASVVDHRGADGLTAADHARGWGDAELLGLLESYRLAQLEARELAHVAPVGAGAVSASRL